MGLYIVTKHWHIFPVLSELAKEEDLGMAVPRSGAITPDGLIDDDFEAELGSQSEVSLQSTC